MAQFFVRDTDENQWVDSDALLELAGALGRDSVDSAATPGTIPVRGPGGELSAAPATDPEHVVTLGQAESVVAGKVGSGGALDAALSSTFVTSMGTTPPSSPHAQWLSTRYTDVAVSHNPADRHALFAGQEPSVWRHGGQWHMTFSGTDGTAKYTSCDGDPLVAANWTTPVTILKPSFHGQIYIEEADGTLHYFCKGATQAVYHASASIDAPTVWTPLSIVVTPTLPPGTSTLQVGNVGVVKDLDGTYRMFLEVASTEALGGEPARTSWQVWVSPPSSSLTSWSDPVATGLELTSLRPQPASSVGNLAIVREADQWVAYYHSSNNGRPYPTVGFRAVSSDLGTDAWTVLDQRTPFVRRAGAFEVDQLADLAMARDEAGVGYLWYVGARNFSPIHWHIMVTPLIPTLVTRSESGVLAAAPAASRGGNGYVPRVQSSTPWLDPGVGAVGTWALDAGPAGTFGGCCRVNTSAANGDEIRFDVLLAPGAYRIRWVATTGPDYGGCTILTGIGNPDVLTAIGFPQCYSAAETPNVAFTYDFTVLGTEAAVTRIVIRVDRKHASSAGYRIGDQGWSLTRLDWGIP